LGIYLHDSPNNTLRNNKIVNNAFTLKVDGENLLDFVNDVDVSNTVDGGLVYYWINEKDRTIPHDAGWVALINCTRITVQNLVLNKSGQGLTVAYTTNSTITQNNVTANNDDGIYLWFSSNNSIVGNNITNNAYGNGCGIHFWFSSNNSIVGNNITNNGYGIYLYDSSNSSVVENNITANNEDGIHLWSSSNNSIVGNNITANDEHGILLYYSSNNSIYFDNFINNTVNADSSWSSNIWNSPAPITYTYNGSEYVNYLGSYWSDYSGIDIDNDGIGDSSYSVDSESDYYPLMQPFETYFQVPSTVEVIMYEITSRTQALTETIISQNATLNTTVTGDFDAVLNFTNLEIVLITSGSFAGKGFSKGNWSTNIEGNSYEGSWQGMLFKKPEERKISLKGMVSGGLKGIVEGFLSESVNGSEIYDQYQATWTISHIGADVVFAKLNLNGTIDYQESVEYSSELYALQTSIQGEASGYYDGALSIVLTQVLLTCRGIG
jgi:parallel beta-helix repeat protein